MSDLVSSGGARTRKGPKKRYSHRFPPELWDWLEEQSETRGCSIALLVNRAVEHYKGVLPPPPPSVVQTDDVLAEATAALRAGL